MEDNDAELVSAVVTSENAREDPLVTRRRVRFYNQPIFHFNDAGELTGVDRRGRSRVSVVAEVDPLDEQRDRILGRIEDLKEERLRLHQAQGWKGTRRRNRYPMAQLLEGTSSEIQP